MAASSSGQTAVRALGSADQHSQLQLYLEGPRDKVVLFLRVEDHGEPVDVPAAYQDLDDVGYLGGHSLGELLNGEQHATESRSRGTAGRARRSPCPAVNAVHARASSSTCSRWRRSRRAGWPTSTRSASRRSRRRSGSPAGSSAAPASRRRARRGRGLARAARTRASSSETERHAWAGSPSSPRACRGRSPPGEVVERPASVVKELVENALDAGARHVDVQARAAAASSASPCATTAQGMAPEDAPLAFARHATSKLTSAEDLAAVAHARLPRRGAAEHRRGRRACGSSRGAARRRRGGAVEADAAGARARRVRRRARRARRRGARPVRDHARAAEVPAHAADRGRARRRRAHAPRGRAPGDGLPARARRPRGAVATRRCADLRAAPRPGARARARAARWSSARRAAGGRRRCRLPRTAARDARERAARLDVRRLERAGRRPSARALGARPAPPARRARRLRVATDARALSDRGALPRACRRARST